MEIPGSTNARRLARARPTTFSSCVPSANNPTTNNTHVLSTLGNALRYIFTPGAYLYVHFELETRLLFTEHGLILCTTTYSTVTDRIPDVAASDSRGRRRRRRRRRYHPMLHGPSKMGMG